MLRKGQEENFVSACRRKISETSVKTYSEDVPDSAGSNADVVAPIPAPISSTRSGERRPRTIPSSAARAIDAK